MDNIEEFLLKLRIYAKENYIPVMKEDTAECLAEEIKKEKPHRILEIGTSIGTSGIVALTASEAQLVTVEIDEDTYLSAKNNFALAGLSGRVEQILGDCNEVLMLMEGSFDFVILDGPKGHYKELTELILPMLKKGGIIFADNTDYHNKVKTEGFVPHKHRTIVTNMRAFLSYISGNPSLKVKFLEIGDGIVIIEKR